MVTRLSENETDAVFRALADPTRRDILRRAIRQEQSISTLAARYEMSFAAVQKHVAVLERAAIIEKQRRGKEQIVRARLDTLAEATRLLGEFEALWRERALRIEELLAGPADADPARPATGTTHPETHAARPATGTTHPETDADTARPATGTTHPKTDAGTTHPETGTTHPGTGTTHPDTRITEKGHP